MENDLQTIQKLIDKRAHELLSLLDSTGAYIAFDSYPVATTYMTYRAATKTFPEYEGRLETRMISSPGNTGFPLITMLTPTFETKHFSVKEKELFENTRKEIDSAAKVHGPSIKYKVLTEADITTIKTEMNRLFEQRDQIKNKDLKNQTWV